MACRRGRMPFWVRQNKLPSGFVVYTNVNAAPNATGCTMLVDETEDDSDVEMTESSDEKLIDSIDSTATSAMASEASAPPRFDMSKLPNDILVHIMEQCTAATLLNLACSWRHVRALLRATLSMQPARLLAREQARLTASMQPLDLEGLTIDLAIRAHYERFGKPVVSEYWPSARKLANDYVTANISPSASAEHFLAKKTLYTWIIEYVLWVDAFAHPRDGEHMASAVHTAAQHSWIGRMVEKFADAKWDVSEAENFIMHIQNAQQFDTTLPPLPISIERDILSFLSLRSHANNLVAE